MSEKQPTACVALLGDAAHAFPPDLGQVHFIRPCASRDVFT